MPKTYRDIYKDWQDNPEAFWADAARAIEWVREADRVFDPDAGVYGRWFAGAECNTCFNCVDRHVEAGRGDQAALIYDSPVTDQKQTYSYKELQKRVSDVAAGLLALGVGKGDRVIIYMPMIPQAAFAMLACARIGAIHSVVFGGFAAKELATRIDDAKPKVILSASCGIEPSRIISYKPLLDEAIALSSHKPDACVIYQRPQHPADLEQDRDLSWADFLSKADADDIIPCVPVAATDPLYILYTSGTTGEPKGVVRDNGGHMVALKWSLKNIYNTNPGDVYWAASDVGWVVGHSYIVYGPLLQGCATVLFEGKPVGTPDAGAFWRVIDEHKVSTLFTAPTALRAIKKEDADGKFLAKYDTSSLRTLFLAGERADPDTIQWAEKLLDIPVIDNWWQTETGWPIASNRMGIEELPVKYGSPCVSIPGYEVQILNDAGETMPPGELGNICIKLPLPPGCLPTLWNKDDRFKGSYLSTFPGYYETADAGFIDQDGYISIMARTDDIINVAGHRLSTGGMEEIIAAHDDVAECAVIGIADKLKGQIPIGFVIVKDGAHNSVGDIESECVQLVREKLGAVAALKTVMQVERLPKTRSGKILRGTIRKIIDGDAWKMPATIDDPAILDEIQQVLSQRGFI
ncbi:MAG: propionyl-CoA synthetase [Henriciella sp.]|nr:propionyl-CoA synthetase [Henriciella sp.]